MHRIAAAALAVALSITGLIASPAQATSAHEWQVQVGGPPRFDGAGPRGAGNQFYPAQIAIHPGDSITFSPFGPHTVTYNRPPGPLFALFVPFGGTTLADPNASLNSGFLVGPPFTVTFAPTLPAGLYKFICGLHPGMSEMVNVLPSQVALPKGDADYAAIAQAEITQDLAALDRIDANANTGDGASVWVGAGDTSVSNIRFYPAVATIHVGQSITFWKTHDPTEPHTVTFGPEPADEILALLPRGGSTYGGGVTEQASSGFMSTEAGYRYYQLAGTPFPVALTKYSLTFTNTGLFPYVCAIHDGAGMIGWVHVVP